MAAVSSALPSPTALTVMAALSAGAVVKTEGPAWAREALSAKAATQAVAIKDLKPIPFLPYARPDIMAGRDVCANIHRAATARHKDMRCRSGLNVGSYLRSVSSHFARPVYGEGAGRRGGPRPEGVVGVGCRR